MPALAIFQFGIVLTRPVASGRRLVIEPPQTHERSWHPDLERSHGETEAASELAAVDHVSAVPRKTDIGYLFGEAVDQTQHTQQCQRHAQIRNVRPRVGLPPWIVMPEDLKTSVLRPSQSLPFGL
ncbi:hypothetical protein [Polymorphobacter megasporae]|uniref:hypothetical protein n=1 Tax=Glacieibacterium megasporae TaxID=2835787 RepID=UPI001C1E3D1D|nr:hypothetical protein [Polymorphobacter megasporae]UAJ08917.1 hypothetical protein KTC28_11100 [Polymorphobacter megasporae]